jgi:transposase
MEDTKAILRRRHSAALKAQVLAECDQPGASVASVALKHGLNANLVHRWRRLARGPADEAVAIAVGVEPAAFVPLQLPPPPVTIDTPAQRPSPDICVELHRGTTAVKVTWPAAAAAECATWLRELLR